MMDRVPETNRYVTRLEQELAELRQRVTREPEPEPTIDGEGLAIDPAEAISKFVDSKFNTINRTVEERLEMLDYQQFVASKPDFDSMRPLMAEQLQMYPHLADLKMKAFPVLYKMAKAEQLAKAKAAPAQPATPADKSSAQTSVGKKETTPSRDDPSYWRGKTLKEMEAELGFAKE